MFVCFYLKLFEASHYILFLTRWRHLPLNEETGLRCDRIWQGCFARKIWWRWRAFGFRSNSLNNVYLTFPNWQKSPSFEFSEIPNISRQTEQAGKLTYMILYFHIKLQQCMFLILHSAWHRLKFWVQLQVGEFFKSILKNNNFKLGKVYSQIIPLDQHIFITLETNQVNIKRLTKCIVINIYLVILTKIDSEIFTKCLQNITNLQKSYIIEYIYTTFETNTVVVLITALSTMTKFWEDASSKNINFSSN